MCASPAALASHSRCSFLSRQHSHQAVCSRRSKLAFGWARARRTALAADETRILSTMKVRDASRCASRWLAVLVLTAAALPGMLRPAAACPNGYSTSAPCVCKSGWGSHVPGWKDTAYPTAPPRCAAFTQGKDAPYKAGMTFKRGVPGPCLCFPCPKGYSSIGGPLNATSAACAQPQTFFVRYTASTAADAVCAQDVRRAVQGSLLAGLRKIKGVAAPTARVTVTNCGASGEGTSMEYTLTLQLSYLGSGGTTPRTTMMRVLNTPGASGRCSYNVCEAVAAVSERRDSLTSVKAQTKAFPNISKRCKPPKCDDRICTNGVCDANTGLCRYSPQADGTTCRDPAIRNGKCAAGMCVGLVASVRRGLVGSTETITFEAKFATATFEGREVLLHAATADGEVLPEVYGRLYDDGDRRQHRDAKADDGVFTNPLTVTLPANGEAAHFAAVMGDAPGDGVGGASGGDGDVPPVLLSLPLVGKSKLPGRDKQRELGNKLREGASSFVKNARKGGASPEAAIKSLFDALKSRAGARSASDDDVSVSSASLQPAQIDPLLAGIDLDTIVFASDRRIEFLSTEGLPCVIVATDGLEMETCPASEAAAAAAAAKAAGGGGRRLMQLALHSSGSDAGAGAGATLRRLHAAVACPFARGTVLVLAPFLANFNCGTLKDESVQVAAEYRAAGYDVIFKCNDPVTCPAGPPTLDDFVGWGAHAAVIVTTTGDADDEGLAPLLLTPTSLGDPDETGTIRFADDWMAGRLLLSADGGFAITPAFLEKHANSGGPNPNPDGEALPGQTVVFFSADRSALGTPPPFAAALSAAAAFSGFSNYLSRLFEPPRPGIAMAQHLLRGGAAGVYPFEGQADLSQVYDSTFRTIAANPDAQLTDKCSFVCAGIDCAPKTCPDGSIEGGCSRLSGTCDTACCGKLFGTPAQLRGFETICEGGQAKDLCDRPVCASTDCRKLTETGQVLCNPATGACPLQDAPDGTTCRLGGLPAGVCRSGVCVDLCARVDCKPTECETASECNPKTGNCSAIGFQIDNKPCSMPTTGSEGTCQRGVCLATPIECSNYVGFNSADRIIRAGDAPFTTAPAVVSDCLPLDLTLDVTPLPERCSERPASLVVRKAGIMFLSCFTYATYADTGSVDGGPMVGPAVAIQPQVGYPGKTIYITDVLFGDAPLYVEDCTQSLELHITNSAGKFVLELPCMLDPSQTFSFPGAGAVLPAGEQSIMELQGMSALHVMSVRTLYYKIYG